MPQNSSNSEKRAEKRADKAMAMMGLDDGPATSAASATPLPEPKPKRGDQRLEITLPKTLREEFKAAAAASGMTLTAATQDALRQWLSLSADKPADVPGPRTTTPVTRAEVEQKAAMPPAPPARPELDEGQMAMLASLLGK